MTDGITAFADWVTVGWLWMIHKASTYVRKAVCVTALLSKNEGQHQT